MPMPAHLEVEGNTQGKIDGSCDMQGRENTILVEGFDHEVYIPRDPQSGLPTGKRVHNAMKVVKTYDNCRISPTIATSLHANAWPWPRHFTMRWLIGSNIELSFAYGDDATT